MTTSIVELRNSTILLSFVGTDICRLMRRNGEGRFLLMGNKQVRLVVNVEKFIFA